MVVEVALLLLLLLLLLVVVVVVVVVVEQSGREAQRGVWKVERGAEESGGKGRGGRDAEDARARGEGSGRLSRRSGRVLVHLVGESARRCRPCTLISAFACLRAGSRHRPKDTQRRATQASSRGKSARGKGVVAESTGGEGSPADVLGRVLAAVG